MYCKKCGSDIGDAKFCSNCGAAANEQQSPIQQQIPTQPVYPVKKKKTPVAAIVVLVVAVLLIWIVVGSSKSSSKSPAEAANSLNNQIATTQKPSATSNPEPTKTPEPEVVLEEINPDIPLGTTYELGQGTYECGDDIPAGRYVVEWVSGNQFGGTINATNGAKYLGSFVSIDPQITYTCILSAGDTFEISLSNLRFTKITSLPNDNYKQPDGSYLLGSGYFFEGIDIPEGKYNVTAVGGNQFGISISTRSKSFLSLDQNETYNNLKLDNTGSIIEVSLGQALFEPVA